MDLSGWRADLLHCRLWQALSMDWVETCSFHFEYCLDLLCSILWNIFVCILWCTCHVDIFSNSCSRGIKVASRWSYGVIFIYSSPLTCMYMQILLQRVRLVADEFVTEILLLRWAFALFVEATVSAFLYLEFISSFFSFLGGLHARQLNSCNFVRCSMVLLWDLG